jgi:dolichyl-phosphate-mannose-protein mannosyltransferase
VEDFLTMHRAMIRENIRLAATHPDASAPWTWPLMKVAPYFWQGDGASIYLVGNPVVWWGSSLALLAFLPSSWAEVRSVALGRSSRTPVRSRGSR